MRLEHVDRRVLGAVGFVDAGTGQLISDPLDVIAEGVRWLRNGSDYYVIANAPGLAAHIESFEQPPAEPPVESISVELQVSDPTRKYLSRRMTIRLPRDPEPEHADLDSSLFRPVIVWMFRAPGASTETNWAVIRATVRTEGSDEGLGGALIRVVRASDSTHIASGLTDSRGEALIPVPGIPVTTWDEGGGEETEEGPEDDTGEGPEDETSPVLTNEVEVTLELVFDPDAEEAPDPDDLEARRVELLVRQKPNVMLASGREIAVEV